MQYQKKKTVLRYNGFWKDVGTWDAVSEVMEDKTKGRVTLDGNCMNTNVVNELDIPLLCIECNDNGSCRKQRWYSGFCQKT